MMPRKAERLQLLPGSRRTEGADKIHTGHATAAEAVNPSITNLDIDCNAIDALAVLANDTLHLASRSGLRSDARAAVYLHKAVYFAHLAIEELAEGEVAL